MLSTGRKAVASTLAKYQKSLGHETAVVLRGGRDFGSYKVVESEVPIHVIPTEVYRSGFRFKLKAGYWFSDDVRWYNCFSIEDNN